MILAGCFIALSSPPDRWCFLVSNSSLIAHVFPFHLLSASSTQDLSRRPTCSVQPTFWHRAMEVENRIKVQRLAESSISEVPPQYIQPPDKRPNSLDANDSESINIPEINLSGIDRYEVREAIGKACREWGAFHVTNHGIPLQLLQDMKTVGLSFFKNLPFQEKIKYACNPNTPASQGYGSKMLSSGGGILDWRDYFDHHTLPLSRRHPLSWPRFPPNYRQVVSDYSDHMSDLASDLLALISESLGLPSSCIEDAVGEFYQNITVSYYPPCPQPELTLGLQSHSDMGALTLLIQDDVPGLQVHKDSHWITVQPISSAIVVLLADQTEIISNGEYRSCEHRAITNYSRERLSVATFHDPAKTAKISPAAELLSKSSACRYGEVLYGDYVSSWYTKGPEGKRNIDALVLDL